MKQYGFIYCTTNHVNGKKYIGQHRSNPSTDDKYLGSGVNIRNAFKKYGKSNFTREILEWAESQDELDELEKEYIEKYNAVESDEYYNIAPGGFTHEQSAETRDKIRSTLTGIKRSEETKKKMSDCKRRENLSDETRKKLSEKAKSRVITEEWKDSVRNGLAKYRETDRYKARHTETLKRQEEREQERRTRAEHARNKPIKVRCIETGEVFDNLHAVSKTMEKVDFRNLSAHLKGRIKHVAGFHFEKVS